MSPPPYGVDRCYRCCRTGRRAAAGAAPACGAAVAGGGVRCSYAVDVGRGAMPCDSAGIGRRELKDFGRLNPSKTVRKARPIPDANESPRPECGPGAFSCLEGTGRRSHFARIRIMAGITGYPSNDSNARQHLAPLRSPRAEPVLLEAGAPEEGAWTTNALKRGVRHLETLVSLVTIRPFLQRASPMP